MAKRLLDTSFLDTPQFMELPAEYKAVWFYLNCKATAAGLFIINFKLLSMCIGTVLDEATFWNCFKGKIFRIYPHLGFIPDVPLNQFNNLDPIKDKTKKGCKAKESIVKTLHAHGLIDENYNILVPLESSAASQQDAPNAPPQNGVTPASNDAEHNSSYPHIHNTPHIDPLTTCGIAREIITNNTYNTSLVGKYNSQQEELLGGSRGGDLEGSPNSSTPKEKYPKPEKALTKKGAIPEFQCSKIAVEILLNVPEKVQRFWLERYGDPSAILEQLEECYAYHLAREQVGGKHRFAAQFTNWLQSPWQKNPLIRSASARNVEEQLKVEIESMIEPAQPGDEERPSL